MDETKISTEKKVVLYDPKAWPFGPLSPQNIDDLFLDEKKYPTVINYVLTNTLVTPIYKLGLQFASIQPRSIDATKKEERIKQIIETVAGHEKRLLTEAEMQEIRNLVNWEQDMAVMNIYEKWHHFLYKERVDTTYKALEAAFKAKYEQDPIFAQSLNATGDRAIEYISPNTILGTGPQEERADGSPDWNGLNLLGVCLTQLRHREGLARAYQAKQELETRQREEILNVWRAENILLYEIQKHNSIERFLGKSAAEIVAAFPEMPDQPLLHDSIVRMYKRQRGPVAELYRKEITAPGSLADHYYQKVLKENKEKTHLQKMRDIIVMYTEYIIEQSHPEFSREEVAKAAEQLEWTAPSVEAYNILRAKIIKLYKERKLPAEALDRISMFIEESKEASEDASEEVENEEKEEETREETSSTASSSDSDDPLKQLLGTEKDKKALLANRLAEYTGRKPKKYKSWSIKKLKTAIRHYQHEKTSDSDEKEYVDEEDLPEEQGEWILYVKRAKGEGKIEIGRRQKKPTLTEIEEIVKKYNKKNKKLKPAIDEDQIFFLTDYPRRGVTTVEIRHGDGSKENFSEYNHGPQKVVHPNTNDAFTIQPSLPDRKEIVEEYNSHRKIKPSQIVVSWAPTNPIDPILLEEEINIEEPEIIPIRGSPIKVFTSVTENSPETGVFSPVYEKDFEIDGLFYPTVAHYITTCLLAATGMKINERAKPAYTRGMPMVEAYNLLSSPQLHRKSNMIPINDATQIWETRYNETFRELLKEFSRIALNKKFTQSGMQNLLLLTGDKEIIWGDKHDAFLGLGERPAQGSNTIGKLMMEIRGNLKGKIDSKTFIPYLQIFTFFLQDPFMRNWIRRRVKEMIGMVSKLHALTPEEEITPKFIDNVLKEMYIPCNTVNSLNEVEELSTLPRKEIAGKKKESLKVVPYMPREFVILVDECNGLPPVEDTVTKEIEEKKKALEEEEKNLDIELNMNLAKNMSKLEKEISLSREDVAKKIQELEKTAAFQKKNSAEQNKERAKIWRSMSREVNTKLDQQAGKITHAIVDRKSLPKYIKNIAPIVDELLELYKKRKEILEHRDRMYEEISIAYWERATSSIHSLLSLLKNTTEDDVRKLIIGAEELASKPSLCTNIGVELQDPAENCIASALVNILVGIERFTKFYKIEFVFNSELAVSILLGKSVKRMPELNFPGYEEDESMAKRKKKKEDDKEENKEEDKASIATSVATSAATEEAAEVEEDEEKAISESGFEILTEESQHEQDYEESEPESEKEENDNEIEEAAEFGFRRKARFGVGFAVKGHIRGAPTVDLAPYIILVKQVVGEDHDYTIFHAKQLASAVKAVKDYKFMDEGIKRTRINFFATLR